KSASRPFVSSVAKRKTDGIKLSLTILKAAIIRGAMRSFLLLVSLLITALTSFTTAAMDEAPLRIFIRSGPKSHGPGAHDYPRFLKDWVPLLNERGAKATGADAFPPKAQLDETDVLVLH